MPRVPGVPYSEDRFPWEEACEAAHVRPPYPDWLRGAVELAYWGRGDHLRKSAPADRSGNMGTVRHRADQVLRVMKDPETRAAAFAAKQLAGSRAGAAVVDAAIERGRAEFAEWCRAQGLP